MRRLPATLAYEVAAVRLNTPVHLHQRSWTRRGQISGFQHFGERAIDSLASLALRQYRAKQSGGTVRGLKACLRFSSWVLLDAEAGGAGCFPGSFFVGAEKIKLQQVRKMMATGCRKHARTKVVERSLTVVI